MSVPAAVGAAGHNSSLSLQVSFFVLCSKAMVRRASVGAPREDDDDCVSAISLCISRVVSISNGNVKVSFWDMLSFSFCFLHCGESRRPNKKLPEEEHFLLLLLLSSLPSLSATAPFLIGNIAIAVAMCILCRN